MIARAGWSVNPRRTDSWRYSFPGRAGDGPCGALPGPSVPGRPPHHGRGRTRTARVENAPGGTAPVGRPPHRERGKHQHPARTARRGPRSRPRPRRTCPERRTNQQPPPPGKSTKYRVLMIPPPVSAKHPILLGGGEGRAGGRSSGLFRVAEGAGSLSVGLRLQCGCYPCVEAHVGLFC